MALSGDSFLPLCLCICVYVHMPQEFNGHGSQRRVLDALELVLQVVNEVPKVDDGNYTWDLWKSCMLSQWGVGTCCFYSTIGLSLYPVNGWSRRHTLASSRTRPLFFPGGGILLGNNKGIMNKLDKVSPWRAIRFLIWKQMRRRRNTMCTEQRLLY